MKKIWKFILYIILFLIFILSIYKLVVAPYIFEYYRIDSNNMSPTINKWDLIWVYKLNGTNINRNDIILLEPVKWMFNESVWTYRIKSKEKYENTINTLYGSIDKKHIIWKVVHIYNLKK